MKIADREIGPGHPPFVIAEIGGNHGGSKHEGYDLIHAAMDAGADAVKLQCYTADSLTFRGDGNQVRIMEGPWAGKTLHGLYSEAQTPFKLVEDLVRYGQRRGALMFSSVFDLESVAPLVSLGVPAFKIASFELTDLPLIGEVSKTGLPLIISTGMGTSIEIKQAMESYQLGGKLEDLGVLHCISSYPALPSESNLPALGPLSELLGGHHVVGLSDHTLGCGVAAAGVAFGASIVEKHLTLDRSRGGPDAGFSLEPDEFRTLVRTCHEAWQAIQPFVPAQRPANLSFRKSLFVVANVLSGERLSKANVRSLRPASGLAPSFYQTVLAGVATRDLQAGTPLDRSMVSTLCQ